MSLFFILGVWGLKRESCTFYLECLWFSEPNRNKICFAKFGDLNAKQKLADSKLAWNSKILSFLNIIFGNIVKIFYKVLCVYLKLTVHVCGKSINIDEKLFTWSLYKVLTELCLYIDRVPYFYLKNSA